MLHCRSYHIRIHCRCPDQLAWLVQIFNLFLPRVNIRRQAQWYADGEPQDFSPSDSQVRP